MNSHTRLIAAISVAALIGAVLIGMGIYFIVNKPAPVLSAESTPPETKFETVVQVNEFTMDGKEDIPIGTLNPGHKATIKYLGGKVISNKETGYTAPIWGVPIENTDPSWIPLMPYAKENMWTNAIFIDTGNQRVPFRENQYEVIITNKTKADERLILRFHEARGYSYDNEGNARFSVKVE
jgi:hypothetical protein